VITCPAAAFTRARADHPRIEAGSNYKTRKWGDYQPPPPLPLLPIMLNKAGTNNKEEIKISRPLPPRMEKGTNQKAAITTPRQQHQHHHHRHPTPNPWVPAPPSGRLAPPLPPLHLPLSPPPSRPCYDGRPALSVKEGN